VRNLPRIPWCAVLLAIVSCPTLGCWVRDSPPPREVYVEHRHEEHEHDHDRDRDHDHDEHREHRGEHKEH
jgi:hypothetical protein